MQLISVQKFYFLLNKQLKITKLQISDYNIKHLSFMKHMYCFFFWIQKFAINYLKALLTSSAVSSSAFITVSVWGKFTSPIGSLPRATAALWRTRWLFLLESRLVRSWHNCSLEVGRVKSSPFSPTFTKFQRFWL